MKRRLILIGLLIASTVASAETEDWKGAPSESGFTFGALTGAGIVANRVGWATLLTAARRIQRQGFAPDINNQVFIEAAAGPMLISGTWGAMFSAHLRWDFQKDDLWTLYALGGFGGSITGAAAGDYWLFHPRFGIGSFFKITDLIRLRGEVSHELIALGVSFWL